MLSSQQPFGLPPLVSTTLVIAVGLPPEYPPKLSVPVYPPSKFSSKLVWAVAWMEPSAAARMADWIRGFIN